VAGLVSAIRIPMASMIGIIICREGVGLRR
jgi:hypothetical protein